MKNHQFEESPYPTSNIYQEYKAVNIDNLNIIWLAAGYRYYRTILFMISWCIINSTLLKTSNNIHKGICLKIN